MAGFDWFWKTMGARSGRNQKRSLSIVAQAQSRRSSLETLSDQQLRAQAHECIAGDKLIDPAQFLALLSIASQRTLSLVPFDVQLQAVLRLLEGDVIQMATGEGKTLVGAMANTGFALMNKRVHSITVNNYLAQRDATWVGPLAQFFGCSVAAISEEMDEQQRRKAYTADIVYASVNEIGFDVLRDQLIYSRSDAIQHGADIALVDEADSVLVDEALVPLVLAGSEDDHAPQEKITNAVRALKEKIHFDVDEDRRNVFLNEQGAKLIERNLGIENLYDEQHVGTTLVQVNLALHAHALLIKDVHYIVRDGKIALVDSSKGRVADLQRWPDGIQAAVEAKEGLNISQRGKVLDTITIQALMNRYGTVCGMTGTAVEATDQLRQFYDLRVSVIERAQPLVRIDEPDRIYATQEQKMRALVAEIKQIHATGQPILVGTLNVAQSEELAQLVREAGIEVSVLNAKNDEQEARIIAEAGDLGRVTISTQMAGRGTDIRLGGADEKDYDQVVQRGGLVVIGTSRHRTARLDNQLRGRAGRQGDPGRSVFFLSLEDDVLISGGAGEEITAYPDQEGRIDAKRIYDWVEHCQRVTEGQLLEIHAQTWRYNKLLADQRHIIDQRRSKLLDSDQAWVELSQRAPQRAQELTGHIAEDVLEQAAREIMLFHLDQCWSEHLAMMSDVRESIHLRAVARETPIDEYHRIAVREFKRLVHRAVDEAVVTFQKVLIDEDGAHLADVGLTRPSATWTYMVSDNPLSTFGQSFAKKMRETFR
ncbi:accessory Sec system translocase SecA2 [Corynebacterium sp. sy039]|uniref:accessory Sec system translocase SecA2 n=1 Tax=Corynebacterium sp. sy039 TaxID=2599641 RepID=UPI0011B839E4|nr:accessory Sec system translocase SecA2 [Corynebacterium sp. sy039]QDZ42573.1 accessory Sec system translocase SecA2 [Corynebacterium sp. sy039]